MKISDPIHFTVAKLTRDDQTLNYIYRYSINSISKQSIAVINHLTQINVRSDI